MKRIELAYMASALAMMSQGLNPPAYHRENPKPRKCDQKKCKSCKYFRKKQSCSYCEIITTAHRHYVNPMDCACGNYKKRKK